MSDYCFFTRLLSDVTNLPLDVCDYILDFSNDIVPVVPNKEHQPVGWFYYSVTRKPIKDIFFKDEIKK